MRQLRWLTPVLSIAFTLALPIGAYWVAVGAPIAEDSGDRPTSSGEARDPFAGMNARMLRLQHDYPDGTVDQFKTMKADDIARIEFLRLERQPDGAVIRKPAGPVMENHDDRPELEGLLALVRKAPDYTPPIRGIVVPSPPDCVMIVHPAKAETFEIPFHMALHTPFGGVHSVELKEALYSLVGRNMQATIIHFDNGKVQEVLRTQLIAPHGGGVYSGRTRAEWRLNASDGLTLYLQVREAHKVKGKDRTVLMDDEHPIHFDDAIAYKTAPKGTGSYIVHLERPQYR